MKKQITLKEAKGLKMTECKESLFGQMLIIFGDKFVCLGVEQGYESQDQSVIEEDLDLFHFGDKELIESGVISKEELQYKKQERSDMMKKQNEERELLQLKRLQQKYLK